MGIAGLLPLLEKFSKRTNINQFAGGTVAIDSYCWLHKGVFSCADKLSLGQQTDLYVRYCMKQIHMLLAHKIKPILVFDGRYLPAKAQTEAKRRESREKNRRKAIELIQIGQHAEGRNLLRRSIEVTHAMALELIKECHKMNIDCIVAPYEADAQLAYLNISGIADIVITEDSDLTLFGCKKVFFKMDINGNGLLVNQEQLHLAMGVSPEHFSMDNFRYMCILSGCDYLPSLPGIGLTKARKFIMVNRDCDIHRALTRLRYYLNMKSLVVTQEYRDAFILAVITFKHQLVFCPLKRKQVRLTPPPSDVTEKQLYYAGVETDPDIALQLAYGNCDPFTLKVLHNFDPDKIENLNSKSNAWGRKTSQPRHISIWSKKYMLLQNQSHDLSQKDDLLTWPNTVDKKAILSTSRLKNTILNIQQDNSDCKELNQQEILNIYKHNDAKNIKATVEIDVCSQSEEKVSPVLIRRINPFSQQLSSNKTSPSLLFKNKSRTKGRNITRVRRTIINEEVITESKFFAKSTNKINSDIVTGDNVLCLTNYSNKMLLEEENTNENRTKETSSINLQTLMLTDEVKTDHMDIDEEHNTSLTLKDYKNLKYPNTSFSCDLKISNLDIEMNESQKCRNDTEESNDSSNLLTLSNFDIDSNFLVYQEDINSSNNLFKSSNTKHSTQISSKAKCDKNKGFSNSRRIVNNTHQSQQLSSVKGQQSLLSMYGFEKKRLGA